VTVAYVGFGANVGPVEVTFAQAEQAIVGLPGLTGFRRSSLWRTAPVGVVDQPWFLNACLAFQWAGRPRVLLDALLDIEGRLGRDRARETAGGPRSCDLDLLLFGDQVLHEPGLIVPHPRVHERAFALAPLVELAGRDLVIPGRGTAGELLDRVYNFERCRRVGRSG
jgi:2-amino-4-hydroxy-6-hydroxymethyldihydropteridine diphosphokinase